MMSRFDPIESKGQFERLARTYHRRFNRQFVGASLTESDLAQEFWIVWHRVSQKFDETRGDCFEALLGVSIRNRAISLAKYHQRRLGIVPVSLHERVSGDEDAPELVDMIASDDDSAEEVLLRQERRDGILSNIDQRLRLIADILADPPEFLLAEVSKASEKSKLADEVGTKSRPQERLTISMLVDLFEFGRHARYQMLDELKEVVAQYD